MAQPERLQVNFCDSSDDDVEHAARIDVVRDGGSLSSHRSNATRSRQDGGTTNTNGGGWWGNAIVRGIGAVSRAFVGDNSTAVEREPFPAAHSPLSNTSRGSRWGYGVYGASSAEPSEEATNTTQDAPSSRSADEEQAGPQDLEIDLRETILQYRRTPADFYINIILASLKAGSVRISGEVFRTAAGCPILIKTFLDTDCVDTNDPEVQQVIQQELNMVLSGDPYKGDVVDASQVDYLRCLCNVKSARVTQEQMVLLRYSGFDFIKMIVDFPYIVSNIPRPRLWVNVFFRVVNLVNFISYWVGIVVSLLFASVIVWTAVHWFVYTDWKNNGYWTIICYVGGYVVGLVTTMRTEEEKIVQYEHQRWPYPANTFTIVPIVPVFELMLMVNSVRYELASDKIQYFVIRYDLRVGIAIQQICHGVYGAIPQIIVQTFLYVRYNSRAGIDVAHVDRVRFWLLVSSGITLFVMSVFSYLRQVIFSHSCNGFGFAVPSVNVQSRGHCNLRRVMPSDIVTRVVLLFTVDFGVSALVTLFISLVNLSGCYAASKTFLSVYIGIAALTIIAVALALVYAEFSPWFGVLSVPMILMQVAYFPFMKYMRDGNSGEPCLFLSDAYASWTVVNLVMFGGTCLSMVVWVIMMVYEVVTHKRIQQKFIDNYLHL